MNRGSLAPLVPTEREADHVDELIRRLACGERSNKLDVLIEIALFQPDETYFDIAKNWAGTKVIYAARDGSFRTCWARDWSLRPEATVSLLRDRLAAQASDTAGGNEGRQPEVTQTHHHTTGGKG